MSIHFKSNYVHSSHNFSTSAFTRNLSRKDQRDWIDWPLHGGFLGLWEDFWLPRPARCHQSPEGEFFVPTSTGLVSSVCCNIHRFLRTTVLTRDILAKLHQFLFSRTTVLTGRCLALLGGLSTASTCLALLGGLSTAETSKISRISIPV